MVSGGEADAGADLVHVASLPVNSIALAGACFVRVALNSVKISLRIRLAYGDFGMGELVEDDDVPALDVAAGVGFCPGGLVLSKRPVNQAIGCRSGRTGKSDNSADHGDHDTPANESRALCVFSLRQRSASSTRRLEGIDPLATHASIAFSEMLTPFAIR